MSLPSRYLLVALIALIACSCKTPVQEREENQGDKIGESFIETNKYIRERHRDQIMAFATRAGWEMTETPTGLWYQVLQRGMGSSVQTGKLVTYTYTTQLINGKICYSADTSNPKKIVVGKGHIEAGLEEGLLLMREGGRARFMIPPYLAHGNFGDGGCIPGSSILIVEVEVLSVNR